MNKSQEIEAYLKSRGASLVSFADLKQIPAANRENLPRAIAIAVALSPESLRDVENGPTSAYYAEYLRANDLLDSLAYDVARLLQQQGHQAKAFVATNEGIDFTTYSTLLPHKTVATLSGMGWIGRCALLVTESFGCAVRITRVLTDAIVSCGTPITESKCGDCRACVEICPGGAPLGAHWKQDIYRDTFFNPYRCREAARKMALSRIGIEETFCGMCIAVCPWTRKYVGNHDFTTPLPR